MNNPTHSVTIARTINASADDLYAAWTDPSIMRRWMGKTVNANVKIGGRYRIENEAADGGVYVHTGEYRVLEPGRRIVQTFLAGRAEPVSAGPNPYTDEFIEVTLRPLSPSQTELTFINGWDGEDMDEEGKEAVKEAWSLWLDLLEAALGSVKDVA